MNKFKELLVWQKAMDLVEQIYVLTADFPKGKVWFAIADKKMCCINTI